MINLDCLSEDRRRKIEKVIAWAQKHKIKLEEMTVAELRRAIKAKG